MSALVRLPDQFRPSRDAPTAATPTCCCCCCCCVSTLVTSSIVLPMRVEFAARSLPAVDPSALGRAKAMAGFAPWVGLAAAIAAGVVTTNLLAFLVAWLLVLSLMIGAAYAPVRRNAAALPTALVVMLAFFVEAVVGLVGILATVGIGYLAIVIPAGVAVVGAHRRKLGGSPPAAGGPMPPGAPPPAPPPPPLPPSRSA